MLLYRLTTSNETNLFGWSIKLDLAVVRQSVQTLNRTGFQSIYICRVLFTDGLIYNAALKKIWILDNYEQYQLNLGAIRFFSDGKTQNAFLN